jgi:uncharacterized protein (TIGR02001 family)
MSLQRVLIKMKKILLATAVAAASFSAPSFAEVSLNGGFVSDYVFRGSQLGDASAYGSVEYSAAGFTAGVWAINDGAQGATDTSDGLEFDVYASYAVDINDELSVYAGLTQYNYSYAQHFEREVNLGASFGPISADVAIGEQVDAADVETDYTYAAVSGSIGNIGLLVGHMNVDASASDYTHVEASTSTDLEGIGASLGITLGHKEPQSSAAAGDQYLFLDLSKDFEF